MTSSTSLAVINDSRSPTSAMANAYGAMIDSVCMPGGGRRGGTVASVARRKLALVADVGGDIERENDCGGCQ